MAYTFRHGDRPLEGLTIQRAVGRGGFGEVYYALTDSGKQVALKYLRDNPEIELRGISHVMNLKSPHLITIYDVRKNQEHEPFVVMEYVSGPSLLELMTAEPKGLGEQKAAFFLNGIAKGLSYLHERGIVHRDLKPGNIFYDDGYVKIGDYGLSKHMSVSRHSGNTVSVGTVHYMAPEIGSGNYTKAIDIYALGVILYEMLTGRLPFTGSSMAEILMRHLQDRPDMGGIPEPFARVIARALQKNPADRFQNVHEMVDAVMSSANISASFQSFDPTSLSQVARDPDAAEAPRTLTTPPRPPAPPPLDARAVAGVLTDGPIPPIPPIPPMPGEPGRDAGRAQPIRGGAADWNRWNPRGGDDPAVATPRERWPAGLTAGIVLVACTALLTVFSRSRQDETAIALGFYLAGGTIGALLTHFAILRRYAMRSPLIDRLLYGAGGLVCALPGLIVASDREPDILRMFVPVLAALVLCDVGKWIDAGRRGAVRGALLWSPAIVGLIAGAIAAKGSTPWLGAGLCAALALLIQISSGLWPVRPPQRAMPPAGGRPISASPPTDDRPVAPHAGQRPGDPSNVVVVDVRPPHEPGRAPIGSGASNVVHAGPIPVSPVGRLLFGIGAILLIAVSLGCFFANLTIRPVPAAALTPPDPLWVMTPPDRSADPISYARYGAWRSQVANAQFLFQDEWNTKGGLLFGTLAPLAALLFVARKAAQRYKLPIWRGTLRWLFASLGLILSSGMIAVLYSQPLDSGERAAAIFGLVVGAVGALGCLVFAGPGLLIAGPAPRPIAAGSIDHLISSAQELASGAVSAASEAIHSATESLRRQKPTVWLSNRETSSASAPAPEAGRIDAPSFAGRAGNAGLSFLGKLLLLGGLAAAVASRAGPIQIAEANGDGVTIGEGTLTIRSNSRTVVSAELEPPVFLIPIAVGAGLLVLARRRDGTAHLTRAFIASGLALGACALAAGPGGDELTALLRHSKHGVPVRVDPKPIVIGAGLAAGALAVLFWPRRRDSKTIVI